MQADAGGCANPAAINEPARPGLDRMTSSEQCAGGVSWRSRRATRGRMTTFDSGAFSVGGNQRILALIEEEFGPCAGSEDCR